MFSLKLAPDTADLAACQSDCTFEFSLGNASEMGLDDPARPVQNDSIRQSSRLVSQPACQVNHRHAPDDQWVTNPVLNCKLAYFIDRIDGDADKLNSIRCMFCLGSQQDWNLFPAGPAPSRPEIDYQDFVPPLSEVLVLPGDIGEPQAHEFGHSLCGRTVRQRRPVCEEPRAGGQYRRGKH
jgi:hypothetical protein